jgi:hypothetical protein
MQNVTALPPAELPQMVNDGYITDVELQSNAGVVVNISRYSNAAKGDYLCLYWDGELFSTLSLPDPDIYSWPWMSVIPTSGSSWPANGPHQVWYTATDAAQNPTTSPTAMAVIDREHNNGLPAPTFPDADAENTITYASVLQNNGTYVRVPWSTDSYSTGDTIYIYWRELDAFGTPVTGSDTSITYEVVSADVGIGFSVLIMPSYVTAVTTTGSAEAWYSVEPLTGAAQSSLTGSVVVDMSGSGVYPAPVIPAGNDGWVDCSEITVDGGVEVDIPASSQFVVNGDVVVYWQGYDLTGTPLPASTFQTPEHILTSNDVTDGFSVSIPADYVVPIGVGSAQIWYSVTAPALPGVSGMANVQIDALHCTQLPAPVFPAAAGDNTITGSEITADNGTDMEITWTGMVAGDTVTAFWVGYVTSPDNPVSGATWTETRILTSAEAQVQQAVFHIPAENISPVENGHGQGKYQVMYTNGGIASSAAADVTVTTGDASSLIMKCATGAPYFDPVVLVRPLNMITLSGPAGASVVVSLPSRSDAWFHPDGVQTLTLYLDENGRGSADVYSFDAGNVAVSAVDISNPAISASGTMLFMEWVPGEGELLSYGISTGAVADGLSSCGVYMQTSADSTVSQAKLALTTSGTSARIIASGDVTAYVDVSETHAAGFEIQDISAEFVSFTLSLLDTGTAVTGQLTFTTLLSDRHPAE